MTAGTLMGMRPEVSSLIAACYNKGCAPPPVGKGGSSQSGPASRSARVRSVQSRGRAVQAVKSGAKGADRQLANARKRVNATETATNNGRRTVTKKPAYGRSRIGEDGRIQHVVEEAGMASERPRGRGTKAGLFGR